MRVRSDDRCRNRGDEEVTEPVKNVDAVVEEMGFANHVRAEADSRLLADRRGRQIVWVNVKFCRW